MRKVIHQTDRLIIGTWDWQDSEWFYELNTNKKVMEYFPEVLTFVESNVLLVRLMDHFNDKGYTYFPVFLADGYQPIGFVGFLEQDFESPFTPAIDLGYRLFPSMWGKGYTKEACEMLFSEALYQWNIERVIAIAPKINLPSQNIMHELDMDFIGMFDHPKLEDYPDLGIVCRF